MAPVEHHTGTPIPSFLWQDQILSCTYWNISFGSAGEINYLLSKRDNRTWFDSDHVIQFAHTTHTFSDIIDFVLDYGKCGENCPSWFVQDFGKSGLQFAKTMGDTWLPKTMQINQITSDVYSITALTQDIDNIYGPPRSIKITVNLTLPDLVEFNLIWYNKTATRLPEALWFTMSPVTSDPAANWTIHKVAQNIPLNNIVINGSQHLHGHWNGIQYAGEDGRFDLNALDSGVVAIGLRSPFPTPLNYTQKPEDGIHFLLWNNIWSTNYPLWYPYQKSDNNCEFRFQFALNKLN